MFEGLFQNKYLTKGVLEASKCKTLRLRAVGADLVSAISG